MSISLPSQEAGRPGPASCSPHDTQLRARIRFAGLESSAEQRLRLAGRLLAAHQIDATITPWDGTRCDLLVACSTDACGARSMDLARRRGTPILAFGNEFEQAPQPTERVIDLNSPVVLLVQSIAELLQAVQASVQMPNSGQPLAFVQLASDAVILNSATLIEFDHHRVCLSLASGRVSSDSLQSIEAVLRELGTAECSISHLSTAPAMPFFVSADSFLLDAAVHCAAKLPPIEDKPWSLSDWPDLGTSKEQAKAMRVVMDLLGEGTRPSALCERHNLSMEKVSSYLWAFKAAGLLKAQKVDVQSEKSPAPEKETKKKIHPPGLFAKLAIRFGFA